LMVYASWRYRVGVLVKKALPLAEKRVFNSRGHRL